MELEEILDKGKLFVNPNRDVLRSLVKVALQLKILTNGQTFAALFDLIVGLEYYRSTANTKWTYCCGFPSLLFYPYVNVCPRCLSKGVFKHTEGKKPASGTIGKITTETLLSLLDVWFTLKQRRIEIYRGSEPIDTILYDRTLDKVIVAEVKAAPLITLPLATKCEEQSEYKDGETQPLKKHSLMDNPTWKSGEVCLFFLKTNNTPERLFPINISQIKTDHYLQDSISEFAQNLEFLRLYLEFWGEAYKAYCRRERNNSVFWLTNACGYPSPLPSDWPERGTSGKGYESISDQKSSVGMDRTDDIKKGVYQVLKLGADYKPKYGKEKLKTALLSNVHAIRHYDEYFLPLKDILWLIDKTRKSDQIKDIPIDVPLYNLFDGVLAFTESDARDEFVAKLFEMDSVRLA